MIPHGRLAALAFTILLSVVTQPPGVAGQESSTDSTAWRPGPLAPPV